MGNKTTSLTKKEYRENYLASPGVIIVILNVWDLEHLRRALQGRYEWHSIAERTTRLISYLV